MNRYYIYNKTRRSWGWMESEQELEIGKTVMVKFDDEDIPELCECEIIKSKKILEKVTDLLSH